MKKKYSSLGIFIFGFLFQIIFVILAINFVPTPIQSRLFSSGDLFSSFVSLCAGFIYLVALAGMYFGIKEIIDQNRILISCLFGIILNGIWFALMTYIFIMTWGL